VHKKTFALAAAVMALGLSTAHAQEKVWKHGILEARAMRASSRWLTKAGLPPSAD
jgi:hypothetical protein